MNIEEKLMQYAQAAGHLQGVLIGMALHDDDIHPIQFTMIYRALERSSELAGASMTEFDRERFNQKAKALGVVL
jgi:hypothetical protein